MKSCILLCIVLLCGTTLTAQKRFDVTLNVDGHAREVVVQVPSGNVPPGGYAVVFMLHGSSGNGERFYIGSGWKELGEQEKFVTCFPSSLSWCILKDEVSSGDQHPHNVTKWVNGNLLEVGCPDQDYVSDVKFVRVMVDSLKAQLSIDPRRVYCCGFSNGSNMTAKLSVEATDVFAAFAGTGGPLHSLDSDLVVTPRPFWFGFGTNDDRFYEPAGLDSLPFNDTTLLIYHRVIKRFLDSYQIEDNYTLDSSDIVRTYTYSSPKTGATNGFFRYSLFNHLTHQFPNGRSTDFDGPRMFWEFFKTYTLPTSVQEHTVKQTSIYPNPATSTVTISGDEPPAPFEKIEVYDAMGQIVQSGVRATTTTTVDVSALPVGTYYVRTRTQTIPLLITR